MEKVTKTFFCQCCNYKAATKVLYNRHITTKKHELNYETKETLNESTEQLKEKYETMIEELKEKYENKLLDKEEEITNLKSELTELKSDIYLVEKDKEILEMKAKEVSLTIDEKVLYITNDLTLEMNRMKDKLHVIELERKDETVLLEQKLKEYNQSINDKEKEHQQLIKDMEMRHENQLLRSQLNHTQIFQKEIVDMSYNFIKRPEPQLIITQTPTQPKTKQKQKDPVDYQEQYIALDQYSYTWSELEHEYPEDLLLSTIMTDDEISPKLYKEWKKGKNYEECVADVLLKEINKDSFYYKNEKEKQAGIYQIFCNEEWLSPDSSDKKLMESINSVYRSISSYHDYRGNVIHEYNQKNRTKNPMSHMANETEYNNTPLYKKYLINNEKLEERIMKEYVNVETDKAKKRIKQRILNEVLF